MNFRLVAPMGVIEVRTRLTGKVNLYNLLAASGAAAARGLSLDQIAEGAASLAYVPGRFQTVDAGQPFTVVVDYAHTDDALRNLTALAREFVAGRGHVITLFGCGGDRDRAKRPKMGRAAGEGSDFVVLTSDNPRSEDPEAILQDALPGLLATGTKFAVEAGSGSGDSPGRRSRATGGHCPDCRQRARERAGAAQWHNSLRRCGSRGGRHSRFSRSAGMKLTLEQDRALVCSGSRRRGGLGDGYRIFHRFAHVAIRRLVLCDSRRTLRRARLCRLCAGAGRVCGSDCA